MWEPRSTLVGVKSEGKEGGAKRHKPLEGGSPTRGRREGVGGSPY